MFVQAGWIVSASLIAPLPVTQAVAVRAPWLPCKFFLQEQCHYPQVQALCRPYRV